MLKVGSLKRRVRRQLATWKITNCTPFWREAHFAVKSVKLSIFLTSVGSCDVWKVHAVVALQLPVYLQLQLHFNYKYSYNYNYTALRPTTCRSISGFALPSMIHNSQQATTPGPRRPAPSSGLSAEPSSKRRRISSTEASCQPAPENCELDRISDMLDENRSRRLEPWRAKWQDSCNHDANKVVSEMPASWSWRLSVSGGNPRHAPTHKQQNDKFHSCDCWHLVNYTTWRLVLLVSADDVWLFQS